ncbi:pantoate--beta-alanine ligase [Clostridium sp. MD294]|uniref:pantoate--beta-alanine ligase n=1 Tax=Clostridium sp. MD294 TaxID=97138 RepID=UPI0002CCB29F|nr:pantoate--beta-alanine ligase [Clostridium sp. MD294]NDO46152.1 pantoate--beta-alanine ligase [Clostridium sp. MD294]USF30182.1 Pantothenate synthetase [Clostridium sp. MD294]
MIIAKTVAQVREQVKQWKKEGLTVGFVPTMGYLHEGHASLAKQSVALCNKTVASVFVNPIQFGPSEDLVSYPRDFEHDCAILEKIGVDLVFHPSSEEMYAPDFCTYVDMENLTTQLCGKSRPGHFKGVCTVVSKLFHIVQPNKAFFGEKDAQQLAVIRRMVRDLSFDIEIVGCPIVREADGLAKSSRNVYLNAEERKAALILSKTVLLGKEMIAKGERSGKALTDALKANIQKEPLARVDYVDVVNGISMEPIENLQGQILVAMAVFIGKTRLIDNFSITL